jgi:hypothetical protein
MTAEQSVQPRIDRPGKWFSWDEFGCNDNVGTPYPVDLRASNGVRLGRELDRIRERVGGPVHLTSVYRTWAHHAGIYASLRPKQTAPPNSYHLQGMAADVACPAKLDWLQFVALIKAVANEDDSRIRYVKLYRPPHGGLAHIDIRPTAKLVVEYLS